MELCKSFLHDLRGNLSGLLTIACLMVSFVAPHAVHGAGLTVEPGGLLIQKVPPGEVYDLYKGTGISLKIYNRLDRPNTYRIAGHRPSETGGGKWMAGYQEIPDPGWLSFDRGEVTIGPQGVGEVRLYLNIPPDPRYYNQRWAVTVAVEGQPVPGEVFSLAAYLPFEIETESQVGGGKRPWGKIGVEPSLLVLEPAKKAKIKIYNNAEKDQLYRLRTGIPRGTPASRQIGLSPGFNDLPDASWIITSHKEIKIREHGAEEVTVWTEIPGTITSSGPWETLLWIESDSGEKTFIRLDVK
ncbi:MAG: hypothetical protein HZB32_01385 [Nitrospirae bacterium]|nr:hypothetical protein [Nitrospirota bacterium]